MTQSCDGSNTSNEKESCKTKSLLDLKPPELTHKLHRNTDTHGKEQRESLFEIRLTCDLVLIKRYQLPKSKAEFFCENQSASHLVTHHRVQNTQPKSETIEGHSSSIRKVHVPKSKMGSKM